MMVIQKEKKLSDLNNKKEKMLENETLCIEWSLCGRLGYKPRKSCLPLGFLVS